MSWLDMVSAATAAQAAEDARDAARHAQVAADKPKGLTDEQASAIAESFSELSMAIRDLSKLVLNCRYNDNNETKRLSQNIEFHCDLADKAANRLAR